MRVAKVVGKVSLSRAHPTLKGKRWVLAVPLDLQALATATMKPREELVVIDELGANEGTMIGVTEGMEAAFPYTPDQVPVDAYVSCIIDEIELNEKEASRLLGKEEEEKKGTSDEHR